MNSLPSHYRRCVGESFPGAFVCQPAGVVAGRFWNSSGFTAGTGINEVGSFSPRLEMCHPLFHRSHSIDGLRVRDLHDAGSKDAGRNRRDHAGKSR